MINGKNNEETQSEYTLIQKKLLQEGLVSKIRVMMPIKLKIFQEKFMKMENFEETDCIDVVLNKIDRNIHT